MGVWGTAIFADDTAADTRDHFTDLAAEGLSAEEATKRLIAESAEVLEDDDEAMIFWLALAATQWKLGRLTYKVRTKALKIIDSGRDLKRWKENTKSDIKQREKHLAKLREQLLGPELPEKKLRRVKKITTDFKPGDIASYKLDEHRSIQFAVLSLSTDRGGT
jgi:hypothetical protein